MSLLDIQQLERDAQAQRNELKMAPKSLLEIQEQERKDEQAKVAELEFQRWWAAEEARVAAEASKANAKQGKRKTAASGTNPSGTPGPGPGQSTSRPKNKKKGNAGPVAEPTPSDRRDQPVRDKPADSAKPKPPKVQKAPRPPQASGGKKPAPAGPAGSIPPVAHTPPVPSSSPMPASLNPFAKPFGFVPGPPAGPLAGRRA